jgi:hypothetical protein
LAETREIDADDESEEEEDSDDDDDDSDDEDAELQRELERVRREREEKKKKEVRQPQWFECLLVMLMMNTGSRTAQDRRGSSRAKHRSGQPSAEQARLQHEAPLGRRRRLQEPGSWHGGQEQEEGVCQCELRSPDARCTYTSKRLT